MSLGALINDVVADLAAEGEEGITAAVSSSISLAISHYETQRWWFLETRGTITSSSSQEYYSWPSDFRDLDSITITVNNNTYQLNERHYSTLEDWFVQSSSFTGYPTDFASYGDEFRLYPVPNGAYNMTLSYNRQLGPGTAGASNSWITECNALIRSRAEWHLYTHRYHDIEAATLAKASENDALGAIRSLNNQRLTTGKTRRRKL